MINQKLYLIPTTPSYEYEPYDHIYLVKASSSQEAYQYAKSKLDANIPQELQEYESYISTWSHIFYHNTRFMSQKNMIYLIQYFLTRKDLSIWHISR